MLFETDAPDRLLADLIVQGRKKHKLTQERLAEMIGVDCRTVQRWESGESIPQPLHIEALAIILPEMRESFREAVQKNYTISVQSDRRISISIEKHQFQSCRLVLKTPCFSADRCTRIGITSI